MLHWLKHLITAQRWHDQNRCSSDLVSSAAVTTPLPDTPVPNAGRFNLSPDTTLPPFRTTPAYHSADSALDPGHALAGLEELARTLTASGRYRVLRRFETRRRYAVPSTSARRTAAFVDVETTGLDPTTDRIIEFAAVPFEYDGESGQICDVHDAVVYLEDPETPIPQTVIELTGITDDMVRGHRIDDAAVGRLLERVDLVIAHNASFDRRFLERRLPVFAQRPWACSQREVPWHDHGCRGTKLDYILFQRCAEFFDGHRAADDCFAGIHVLATPLLDGRPPFRLLLESARMPTYRVWAPNAGYHLRNTLKARGYHWFAGDHHRAKSWYRDCARENVADECRWLDSLGVPGPRSSSRVERITARDRYSVRA